MKYFVWLEYYANAPVSKNVKSDELKYADGHKHGVQPSQSQVDSLQPSLEVNVAEVYAKYKIQNPASNIPYPGNATVQANRSVKTRSER